MSCIAEGFLMWEDGESFKEDPLHFGAEPEWCILLLFHCYSVRCGFIVSQ